MGRMCSLCVHEQREQIDREIIAGLPYRDISGRFALSKSAVERHASEHLADAIARAGELGGRITADRLIAELRALRETTIGVLEEARADGDGPLALSAIARLEKQAELCGRLAGELVDRSRVEQVSVLFCEQWARLRPLLVVALLPYPEARAALLRALDDAER